MAYVHCKCGFVKKDISDKHIGKEAKCPKCSEKILVRKNDSNKKKIVKNDAARKKKASCPKCGFERKQGDESCPKCGIIYKKYIDKFKCYNPKCDGQRNLKDKYCTKCEEYYKTLEQAKPIRDLPLCPSCNEEIPIDVHLCPNCGEQVKNQNREEKIKLGLGCRIGCILLVAVFIVFPLFFYVMLHLEEWSKPEIQIDPDSAYSIAIKEMREDPCSIEVKQVGRQAPQYEGLKGYLKVKDIPYQQYSKAVPKSPWTVPLLQQAGPNLWEKGNETLPAKTPVLVLTQHLKHKGYGRYDGYLVVQTLENAQKHIIDHKNFVITDYWNCSPYKAAKYGPFIARVSDGARPIYKGRWQEMGEIRDVYCPKQYNKDAWTLECYMYKKYQRGFGGIKHIFSSSVLTIVY